MIDEDGYAYPCPWDLIEKRSGRIFAAIESVDNSNGNCGDKYITVIHKDDKLDILSVKKLGDLEPVIKLNT